MPAPGARTAGQAARAAASELRGAFFLVQADRVFSQGLLDALLEAPLDGVTLAVVPGDTPQPQAEAPVFVRDAGAGRVRQVGPQAAPDALAWAGLATCDDTLFDVLAESGDDLTRAFAYLTRAGCAHLAPAPARAFSLPLETRADQRRAERALLDGLRKPEVDGIVARHLNRHVSLALTRRLMNLPVRPNVITGFNLLVAAAAGLVAAAADATTPWLLGLGAALWQLASMLDGTDGELARLKFQTSKAGEWFDTIVDDLGRVFALLGIGYGAAHVTGESVWWELMVITVLVQGGVNLFAYRKMLAVGAGSHLALAWTQDRDDGDPGRSFLARWAARLEFFARRDFYIFTFMLVTLAGLVHVAITLTFVITMIILVHDLVRGRDARDERVMAPLLLRDE